MNIFASPHKGLSVQIAINLRVYLWILCCLSFQGLFCSAAYAHVVISSNYIPGLLENRELAGPYNKLIKELNHLTKQEIKVIFYPPERAGIVFDNHKVDCLFPANPLSIDKDSKYLASQPINYVTAYVFGNKPFNLQQLLNTEGAQYQIAYRRGNTFGGALQKLAHHNLIDVNLDAQSFGMLEKHRVDFVVGYLIDVKGIIDSAEEMKIYYSNDTQIYVQSENFVCHRSDKNASFVSELDQAISDLKENGKLKQILGESYNLP